MAIDGISPAAIVFPLFNFAIRGVQTAYELASVPTETGDYLKTIRQVLSDLKTAKGLRRQKSFYLGVEDLNRVDQVIKNTEEAMSGLEVLVESARVDMAIDFARVGACSRIMWVIRDSNKVAAAMSRLGIASQSLHGEINMLRNVYARDAFFSKEDDAYKRPWSQSAIGFDDHSQGPPPPTYLQATIDAMHERRMLHRIASARRLSGINGADTTTHQQTLTSQARDSGDPYGTSASINNIAEYIRHNEEMLSALVPGAAIPYEPRAAIDVGVANIARDPDNISELECPDPPPLPPKDRPTSFIMPRMPFAAPPVRPASAVYTSLSPQPNSFGLTLLPTSGSAPPSMPNIRPTYANKPRMISSTTLMGSTARLPGHRKTREVRWYDPADSAADVDQPNAQPENGTANGADEVIPVFSAANAATGTVGSNTTEGADLGRTQTRRRPPQLHNNGVVNMNDADVSRNDQKAVNGSVRGRPSRLDWQVQQHRAKMARSGNGGNLIP